MKLPLLLRKLICRCQGITWLSDGDVVFQEAFDDCGEACLKMTIRLFKVPGELPTGAPRLLPKGLGLLEIAEALKHFELETIGFQFSSLDEMKKILTQHSRIAPLIVLKAPGIPRVLTGLGHLVMLVVSMLLFATAAASGRLVGQPRESVSRSGWIYLLWTRFVHMSSRITRRNYKTIR